jgi:hypothetical protein
LFIPESFVNPITTQYNQKSLNNLCNLGLGCIIAGKRRISTAITGINIPKFPALLEAYNNLKCIP